MQVTLVEWLNGEESPFETNDSRLEPRFQNQQIELADRQYGRVVVLGFFFRDIKMNLSPDSPLWHSQFESHQINAEQVRVSPNNLYKTYIANFNRVVERSSGNSWPQIVGIGTASTFYEEATVPEFLKYGCQFLIRAWLWGNDDKEIFDGLGNVVDILRISLVKSIPK